MEETQVKLTAKDFKSDQEVRWCPGCGDHAIMNAIQRALAELERALGLTTDEPGSAT